MQDANQGSPAGASAPTTYEHFLQTHKSQLEGINLPEALWKVLMFENRSKRICHSGICSILFHSAINYFLKKSTLYFFQHYLLTYDLLLTVLCKQRLFIKLKAQIFDAGDAFEFEYDPNSTTTGVDYRVVTKKALQPFADVFVVDHAW